jgi:multidrug efflux pump subunit AcrB
MKRLIEFFLDNKVAANLLAGFLVVAGIAAGGSLIVRLFPDVTLYAVNVTVPYPGATPEEVEESIVEPIEEQLEGLEGVRKVTAVAAENVANVIVELQDGADTAELTNDVRTQIGQITVFPEGAEEPQIAELEQDELIAQLILSGPVDPVDLKLLAQDIRTRLADSPAISRAEIGGVPEYLVDIAVSEAKLQSLGLSLPQLAQIVGSESLDLSAGEIEGQSRRFLVRTLGENEVGEEFEDVIIATSGSGTPLRLGDIATVQDGLSETPLAASLDGRQAVAVSIFRIGDEKVFDIIEAVKAELNSLEGTLPPGVAVTLWQDESENLQSRIDLLIRNAFLGLGLVMVLLLLFLDIRIAFWVAVGVGISFVGALIPMAMTGIAISQLSLFGFILAIGIVVDDAIVVGENVYATHEKGEATGREASRKGTLRVSSPVLFAVTTTIVAFLPLIFLPGVFGQFLGAIAAVVIFVLIMSLVESFFILPRHLSHLSDAEPRRWSPRRVADPLRNRVARRLEGFSEKRLRPAIGKAVAHPAVTLMIATGLLIASFGLMASGIVKFVFFPAVEGNYVTAEVELAESASEQQTRAAAERIAAAAQRAAATVAEETGGDPERLIQGIFWTQGANLGSTGPGGVGASGGAAANAAFVTVKIEDAATRDFTARSFEDAWRSEVGTIAGAQTLTFSADLTGAEAAVTLQVSAEDDTAAREVIAELRREIESIPGTLSVRDDRFRTTDEVQIRLLPQANAYGLTLREVAAQVRGAYFGVEAVRVQRDREEIEVRIRYTEEERSSLATIENQRIFVDGRAVPLSQVASVEIGDAPAIINREDGRRIYSLRADVDVSQVTGGEVTQRILGEVWPELQSEYPGVTVEPGGEQEEQARAQSALQRNFLIALFVIYTLLALSFGSYTQPLVVLIIIPFGLIGALAGHALLGLNLTLLSLFGIIGLAGVIINDSLLMVDYINEALASGKKAADAIIDSAVSRFRPILLTSLTTFLGVTPIILEQSVQAAFLVPTAVSLGFGILVGTALLSFVVPAAAMLHVRGTRAAGRLAERFKRDEPQTADSRA